MTSPSTHSTIGVLVSGGLDSCILLAHLLRQGHGVRPFYVRGGLFWERVELTALREFLAGRGRAAAGGIDGSRSAVGDLYAGIGALTAMTRPTPRAPTTPSTCRAGMPCSASTGVWCRMHGIEQLALATLAGNPFADASDKSFVTSSRPWIEPRAAA